MWAVTVGLGPCPKCGEPATEQHEPGLWPRIRYWLVNGSKAPSTVRCPNWHEWHATLGILNFSGARARSRWWRMPARLVRVILDERSMQPVPLTYLMATGVGVVLGVVLDLIVGWPWWLVTLGFLGLVWLYFVSSVFRGPGSDLRHHLMEVVNPGRAAAEVRRRIKDALSSGALVAYEVAGWDGKKSIGCWSGDPAPHLLSIAHGELFDDGDPWIEVTTNCGEEAEFAMAWVVEDLERQLAEARVPLPGDPTLEDFRQRQQELRAVDPPPWNPASILVDSEPAQGHIARIREHWVAYFKNERVLVSIVAYAVDPSSLRLTALASLSAYE